ncbi:MAG: hypothetical protein KME30_26145 [Iphinoe sp. HA4291-MV1]|jgi:myosin heavy subunit|nr:hypothetical protein [Iphinoe sp. HA4291-MV1]
MTIERLSASPSLSVEQLLEVHLSHLTLVCANILLHSSLNNTNLPPNEEALVVSNKPKSPDDSNQAELTSDQNSIDSIPTLYGFNYTGTISVESNIDGFGSESGYNNIIQASGEGEGGLGGESMPSEAGGWGYWGYSESIVEAPVEAPAEVQIEATPEVDVSKYEDDITVEETFGDNCEAEVSTEGESAADQIDSNAGINDETNIENNPSDGQTDQTSQTDSEGGAIEGGGDVETQLAEEGESTDQQQINDSSELREIEELEQKEEKSDEVSTDTEAITSEDSEQSEQKTDEAVQTEISKETATQEVKENTDQESETEDSREIKKDQLDYDNLTQEQEAEYEEKNNDVIEEANKLMDRLDNTVENVGKELEALYDKYNDYPEATQLLDRHFAEAMDRIETLFENFDAAYERLRENQGQLDPVEFARSTDALKEAIAEIKANAGETFNNLQEEYKQVQAEMEAEANEIYCIKLTDYLEKFSTEHKFNSLSHMEETLGLSLQEITSMPSDQIDPYIEAKIESYAQELEYQENLTEFTDAFIVEAREMNISTEQLLEITGVNSIEEAYQLGAEAITERIEGWENKQKEEFEKDLGEWEYSLEKINFENHKKIVKEFKEWVKEVREKRVEPDRQKYEIKMIADIEDRFENKIIDQQKKESELSEATSKGNIAVAKANIQGLGEKKYEAFSNYRAVKEFNFANYASDGLFDAKVINDYARIHDTEMQILSQIHKDLGCPENESKVSGEVLLYSKNGVCESCLYVKTQFEYKYPNIKVTFMDNKNGRTYINLE